MAVSWGFGIAPVDESVAARRVDAVKHVLTLLDFESVEAPPETADKLTIVEGLFGRALEQDQWDWCVVWEALGSPSLRVCSQSRAAVGRARRNLLAGDPFPLRSSIPRATIRVLERFIGAGTPLSVTSGFVSILSPEGEPNLTFVPISAEAPSELCQSINDEQGEAPLMGVRAAWRVENLARAELVVNRALDRLSPAGTDGLRSLDVSDAKELISGRLSSVRRYRHGTPMVECSLRSGFECQRPVALDERHCGDPEHSVGANGGQRPEPQDGRRRPRLTVDEDFDIIVETPDLDPLTFHAANCHIRQEVLVQAGRGSFWVQDEVQQALIHGLYWRGPRGEHFVQGGENRFSISSDGQTITQYERDTTPSLPDPQLAEPLDALPPDWAPSSLEITPHTVTYFARRHRVPEQTARQELLDLAADARARGKVDKQDGRHRLQWDAFCVWVSIDGRTLVRYRTWEAERTPSQVRNKVPSRFGVNKQQRRLRNRLNTNELANLLSHLEPGQEIEGTVANIVNFGVFVTIGSFDGLIHKSEVNNAPKERLRELFPLGTTLNVRIVSVDRERGRVGLTPAQRGG